MRDPENHFIVETIGRENWRLLSESAFTSVFGQKRSAEFDHIDYALLAVGDQTRRPLGYITCRSIDANSVYWQYGGAFPETRGERATLVWKLFMAGIEIERQKGRTLITCAIDNTNLPFLKMALKAGFLVVGARNYRGTTLVEMALNLGGD